VPPDKVGAKDAVVKAMEESPLATALPWK